jgi:hypothetical protein
MTKNPLINALSAALYIAVVASVMFFGPKFITPVETIVIPIAMLSLFSLSAAVMAWLFFSKPVTMYLEGEKAAAIQLVVHTILCFAGVTAIFFASILLQSVV